jgi:hypothetical protein
MEEIKSECEEKKTGSTKRIEFPTLLKNLNTSGTTQIYLHGTRVRWRTSVLPQSLPSLIHLHQPYRAYEHAQIRTIHCTFTKIYLHI